ncbi:hypothetical protein V5O48_002226 [Marasmius crinis-equi]|uniref:Aromatic amino acid beta-eliminating lyase/threonine aldolase domain-containing protein n=1 Tax=Marasmius crinis-equi TaxID=585013 RepID=A0ABR3FWU2_9AGAR
MSTTLEKSRANVSDIVKFDFLTATKPAFDNEVTRKEIARTFISDTVTVPTREMYTYATLASLGDDVYHEPTTSALEAHIAKITGKEAGLFMPSGTASNQIALRASLKQPPYSVLCDHRAHVYKYEAGGLGFHSGAAVTAVVPANGKPSSDAFSLWVLMSIPGHHLTLEDVKTNITLGTDVHFATTEVVALENTLNGTIFPQDEVIAISDWVHSHGIKMHLDGARIWHVAAETGTSLEELCQPFDSVSLCFSKGLGAPIGSCLVGTNQLIQRARRLRKLFGGGMRQTGILSGSAAYALTYNFPLLPRVHTLARKLEQGLEAIGVDITSRAETCMVFFDAHSIGSDYNEISTRAKQLPDPIHLAASSRLVVHVQTSEEAVDDLLALVAQIAKEKKDAGFVKPAHQANGVVRDVYVRASR